jgi:hypothetical protein
MKYALLILLLFTSSVFAQGLITDSYITEIEQNIELLEQIIEEGLGTDRDEFMLQYYRQKLKESKASRTGTGGNRVAFTTQIANKEPTNNLSEVDHSAQQLLFFTELRNLSGQTIRHRWIYNDQIVYEKAFNVGAARWRVWTQKTVTTYRGTLTVQILNGAGNIIQSQSIDIK